MPIAKIIDCEDSILPKETSTLKWDDKFESVDDTITEAVAIHHIIFHQLEANEYLLQLSDRVSPGIASVIVSYLWMALPTIETIDGFRSCIKSIDNNILNITVHS